MNVLLLSTDKKIFDPGSRVRKRHKQYGDLCDQLHIIIPGGSDQPETDQISGNIWLHSVQQHTKLLTWFGMILLTLKVIGRFDFPPNTSLISTQDPFEVGLAGWLASWWSGLPLNLQVHTDLSNSYFRTQSVRRRFQSRLSRWLIPRVDTLRVVSERVKNFINAKCKTCAEPSRSVRNPKISMLPVYTDADEIRKKSQAGQPSMPWQKTLVIVARLEEEKGVGFAIESLAPLLRHSRDTGLLVIGGGSQRAKLERMVTRLGIPHAVEFAGWKDNPAPYMKEAYLTLVPSYYEGWGMVAVESLVAGTPVVMTEVGCAGELVKSETGGEVVPVAGEEKLQSAVREFLVNEKKQKEYSKRTKHVTKHINTKEEYLDKLQTIWQKTIQNS